MFSFWYLKKCIFGINCFIILICPPWNNFPSLPTFFFLIDCLVASKRSTNPNSNNKWKMAPNPTIITMSSSFLLLLWSTVSLSPPVSLSDRHNTTNRTRARTHHVFAASKAGNLLSTWKELWDYIGMWEENYTRNIFEKTSIITGQAPQLSLTLAKKKCFSVWSYVFFIPRWTNAHPLKLAHAACILLELQFDVASPGPRPHLLATEPTNTPSCSIQYT